MTCQEEMLTEASGNTEAGGDVAPLYRHGLHMAVPQCLCWWLSWQMVLSGSVSWSSHSLSILQHWMMCRRGQLFDPGNLSCFFVCSERAGRDSQLL